MSNEKPLFLSIPHAGERVPVETPWLQNLPEEILMCDVDRYVDRLYAPAAEGLGLTAVVFPWHRYAVDANRISDDVDANSVEDSENPAGKFSLGFHWWQTTTEYRLMKEPMPRSTHDLLVEKYFKPFHDEIKNQFAGFQAKGHTAVYHIDAHSMPSQGTSLHRDPGGRRPQIVVSDRDGTSCSSRFANLVMDSYKKSGFEVAYNWPYKGGRITETYGRPSEGRETVQIEMNRSLYMDEVSKKPLQDEFGRVQKMLFQALARIVEEL